MKYKPINKKRYITNRLKLVKKLKPCSLSIINSNDEMPRNGDQDFPFRQNSDLFYLTGLDQEKCILTIYPDHPVEKYREIIFTTKPNEQETIWYGHKYTKEEISKISGIKSIMCLDNFEDVLKEMMINAKCVYLNFNENVKFQSEVPYKDLRFAKKIKEDFPAHVYERLAPLITDLRVIKESEEIKTIQKACDITENAFRRILKFVKPGIKEYEIEAEITHEFLRNACSGHAYLPIVASGVNACILHYSQNNNECKDGDLLLMDFGAEYGNYAADCSRTIPVNGKFTLRQKECYNAVLRVHKAAIKMFIPGNTIDNINKEVNKLMEKEMIELGLFTKEDIKNQDAKKPMYFKYYMHGTSHFIGLDVHDVGSKQLPFEKGMVLSCEPGIYIKDEEIGIRIENDIVVDDEPINLMKNIPVEVEEIEAYMAVIF
ncbi:MAG: aminopeptidase P N-terminal domain-containing protein [Bacteroidales bacterium]|nr:aminopeptidase P N-terminal domain-containing protein [Bacteroidales bacterium]